MYPGRFEEIMESVRKWEGGLTDHPADRGGLTNMGITRDYYATYLGVDRALITDEMIRDLTWDDAKAIYWKNTYTKIGIEKLPEILQPAVTHFAITSGESRAIQKLQLVVGAKQDGKLGPDTLAKVKAMQEKLGNDKKLLGLYLQEILRYMIRIVKSRPSQIVFLEGWFNRFYELFEF